MKCGIETSPTRASIWKLVCNRCAYINGEKYEELPTIATDKADVEAITIPEYHCYVLGDHRANSRGSRHIGPVPMIALVGKVIGED